MKKLSLTVASILLLTSCIFAQGTQWVMDKENSYNVPVGPCQYEDLKGHEFWDAMNQATFDYNLNPETTVELAKVMDAQNDTQYAIDVYFGAWNELSQIWLPRFMMFAYTMEFKYQQPFTVRLFGCDRNFNCGIEGGYQPQELPTFLVYRVKNNERKLIGSVMEEPKGRIEDDILNIIKNK